MIGQFRSRGNVIETLDADVFTRVLVWGVSKNFFLNSAINFSL